MCTFIEKLPANETFSSTHTHTHTHTHIALSEVPGKGAIKPTLQGTIYKVLNEGRV